MESRQPAHISELACSWSKTSSERQCDLELNDNFGNSSQSENKCCEFLIELKSQDHFSRVKENILILLELDKIRQKQHYKKNLLDQKKSNLKRIMKYVEIKQLYFFQDKVKQNHRRFMGY